MKIAAVHEGWSRNGKRTSLVNKKHYVHKGKAPFWEGFETFLLDQYGYDPKQTLLIINGDGATWIQNAREHFGASAFVCLDRFHIAKEIKDLFHDHPRYRALRKALARYDVDGLFLELNSAVGTLQTEEREERLEKFIALLTKNKQGLRNYRTWLCLEKNISTEGMRPMGSAEGTMHVFAKRFKGGRAWCETGLMSMLDVFLASLNGWSIQTVAGVLLERLEKSEGIQKRTRQVRSIPKQVAELVRQNIPVAKPLYAALKGLAG